MFRACFHDFAENGCISLHSQILALKDDSDIPNIAHPSIQDLADWVAVNQQECFDNFWLLSGAMSAGMPSTFSLDHVWELPPEADVFYFEDINVEMSDGLILNIRLPEDPEDQIRCNSQKDNNDFTFLEADSSTGDIFLLTEGEVDLSGGLFLGSSDLVSLDTSCNQCSFMSTEDDTGGIWLQSMLLDTAHSASISDGTSILPVDRARIALQAPVFAEEVMSGAYVIPAGGAMFVFSWTALGSIALDSLYNAEDIELEHVPGTYPDPDSWFVHPLSFTYIDGYETEWTLETSNLSFVPRS